MVEENEKKEQTAGVAVEYNGHTDLLAAGLSPDYTGLAAFCYVFGILLMRTIGKNTNTLKSS